MTGFTDWVSTELPKRPFAETDGAPGQVPVRSGNTLASRQLVWIDLPNAESSLSFVAGETINGHRAVMLGDDGRVLLAQPEVAERCFGISRGAALENAGVQVAVRDTITEPTWTWDFGKPVFMIANGQLTQTPPASVCAAQVGVAVSATTLLIHRLQPLFLSTP